MGTEIAKKLLLYKAKQALILNEPERFSSEISSVLPENVNLLSEPSAQADFVHIFVKDSEELKNYLPQALRALDEDGLFWISYPKKSSKIKSDLTRDILVNLVREHGYQGVSMISIDDTWSAMRFRPIEGN